MDHEKKGRQVDIDVDSQTVAILARVNELAERFGIKPYEFVATTSPYMTDDRPSGQAHLDFEVTPPREKWSDYEKLLDLIGADKKQDRLEGTNREIIDALDKALHLAPKTRSR